MLKEAFCPAEDWGIFLLTEQLEVHTSERLLERAVRTEDFFMGHCKESTAEGKWKKE